MPKLLIKIKDKINSISEPNPKLWPDPLMRQLIWNQNVTNLHTSLIFLIFFSLVSVICNISLSLKLIMIGQTLVQIPAQILFCRSYLWAWNLYFAIVTFMTSFLIMEMVPEAVYCYIGLIYILLETIMRKTRDSRLTILAGVAQAFQFLTKYKEKLRSTVEEEDPEIFADKFVKGTLACFLFLIPVTILLFKTLDKQTMELSRSKSALEVALEHQKTFIFSFSHELRNPINSLLGNLQLVLQGGEVLSAKATEMINVAKVCGELLLHNINNVLDTGKHDIGKLEVNPVPTRLHELFQRTWSIYSELLRQKKLKSKLRVEKDLPAMVKIDSHKVNQLMLNLIGNAIKFTEKGSVIMTVKWLKSKEMNEKCFDPIPYDDTDEGLFEKEENLSTISTSSDVKFLSDIRRFDSPREDSNHQQERKGILKIIVKDTGSGMKKESLAKLFQKFSQVSDNISQRQIGTGLGLYITREICLEMGGEIRAYSRLGTGSAFVVCIPTSSVPVTNIQRADSETIMNSLKRKQIKALVADDSPFNVNLVCDYLSQFGGEAVSVAYNGYDIFTKYKECMVSNTEIDIVILDIDMPIMDGRKACDSIRQYEKEKKLKPVLIVLMSGNYDKEQVDEHVNPEKGHKADYFLRKPVSFSEFNRTVYNLMTRE